MTSISNSIHSPGQNGKQLANNLHSWAKCGDQGKKTEGTCRDYLVFRIWVLCKREIIRQVIISLVFSLGNMFMSLGLASPKQTNKNGLRENARKV